MTLPDFLKQHRKLHNLTQEELAAKAGVGLRLVRETRCQFKPVMTDDDIARCREVYR